ncbi:hypothetical protein B9G54_06195 [Alloscardovia macacae]|uniref:Antitoxin SocA-like Panacea domain-containing protein n=1 Tax=Alloscardovia macacae TaxID=1160091 RepID=A0A1Y2SZN3_9BIFI|nr:type II toxin-antitoxin system antitoxin SocA domain-containing protein [Alloscardovia macacae]OTA26044.1 hypothetical protein B9G54_06195 [Alloscardovia macacae]OTA29901.1 hypothetical protein B9T39_02170 [Alloscardovia macacae]
MNAVDLAYAQIQQYGPYLRITNAWLNMMTYLIQVEAVQQRHEPLFDEEIRAEVAGPVISSIYQEFRACEHAELSGLTYDVSISEDARKSMNTTYEKYGWMTIYDLLEFVQHEDGPWAKTKRGEVISLELMSMGLQSPDYIGSLRSIIQHYKLKHEKSLEYFGPVSPLV